MLAAGLNRAGKMAMHRVVQGCVCHIFHIEVAEIYAAKLKPVRVLGNYPEYSASYSSEAVDANPDSHFFLQIIIKLF